MSATTSIEKRRKTHEKLWGDTKTIKGKETTRHTRCLWSHLPRALESHILAFVDLPELGTLYWCGPQSVLNYLATLRHLVVHNPCNVCIRLCNHEERHGLVMALLYTHSLVSFTIKWRFAIDAWLRSVLVRLLARNRYTLRHVYDLDQGQSHDASFLWATAACPYLETTLCSNVDTLCLPLLSYSVVAQPCIQNITFPFSGDTSPLLRVILDSPWNLRVFDLYTHVIDLSQLTQIVHTFSSSLETLACTVVPIQNARKQRKQRQQAVVSQINVQTALTRLSDEELKQLRTLRLRFRFPDRIVTFFDVPFECRRTYRWYLPTLHSLHLVIDIDRQVNQQPYFNPLAGVTIHAPLLVTYTSENVWVMQFCTILEHSPALEIFRIASPELTIQQPIGIEDRWAIEECNEATQHADHVLRLVDATTTAMKEWRVDAAYFFVSMHSWRQVVARWPYLHHLQISVPVSWNDHYSLRCIRTILRVCQRLETFVVGDQCEYGGKYDDAEDGDKENAESTPVIVAPRLRVLNVPRTTVEFWHHLELPSMVNLPLVTECCHDIAPMLVACSRTKERTATLTETRYPLSCTCSPRLSTIITNLSSSSSSSSSRAGLPWTHLSMPAHAFVYLESFITWVPALTSLEVKGTSYYCFRVFDVLRQHVTAVPHLDTIVAIPSDGFSMTEVTLLVAWHRIHPTCRVQIKGGHSGHEVWAKVYSLYDRATGSRKTTS